MKQKYISTSLKFAKISILILALIVSTGTAKSQILATWPLNSANKYTPTSVASYDTAGLFIPDPNFGTVFTTTGGFKIKQLSTWPATIPSGNTFNLDFPISPKAGYDVTLSGISYTTTLTSNILTPGASFIMTPFYQIDGKGNWLPLAPGQVVTPTTTSIAINGFNLPLYNNHTYVIRLYITSPSGAVRTDYFGILNVVFSGNATSTSIKPTITTLLATKSQTSPKYTGNVNGSYSFSGNQLVNGGYQLVTQSGICWTTNSTIPPTVSLSTKSNDGSNGSINSILMGLTAGTTYYVRAYGITQSDTLYGSVLSFTTDAPSIPSIITVPLTNIRSNNAACGGIIMDSGGASISQKGVCWSTTQGAETATSGNDFTKDGKGGDSYTSIIKLLQPSTTYYVKAYAINTIGLSYGNEISFTTSVTVPTLSTNTSNLSFGNTVLNSNSPILSYKLSGAYLTPTNDTITITPPIGFSISTSSTGSFVSAPSTVSIPYTNSTFERTIYVKQSSISYGTFSGNILYSGGGTFNPNIDTLSVTGNIIQDPSILTNMGTDFWVGYGLEERMAHAIGYPASYGLQLYIAAGAQQSIVKVSIPGIPSFATQYDTIPANGVKIISGFPTGDPNNAKNAAGQPDCRLYYTGISSKGIHVEVTNNVPVSLFLYDYATNNSSGGSLVLPTNTWSSSYMVQTYGGAGTNTGSPNSYFFVIAKEDNTVVNFKPTAPILDSSASPIIVGVVITSGGKVIYQPNTINGYQITLNKGQIFNAVGLVDSISKTSDDLTGTTVTSNNNKPIAVFAGNARTLINAPGLNCVPTAGSDNLIQQMFPKAAWGNKYLTVPTKTMEYNIFRIAVQDTTTIVSVDDSILPKTKLNLVGMYYEIEGNKGKKIESDKPISVTQFILPGSACGGATIGNNGTGDPEMILLSSVQQAIKSTTVYSSDFRNGSALGGTYINVVIPKSGISSFNLDNLSLVDTGTNSFSGVAYGSDTLIPIAKAFIPYTQDSNYAFARFHVSYPAVHTLSSNIGFNATAYGVSQGESWGYNAGSGLYNLSNAHLPTVTITASDTIINAGTNVTFIATTTNTDLAVSYQWLRNGQFISGATTDSFTTTTLHNGDTISCSIIDGLTSAISNQIIENVNVWIQGTIKKFDGTVIPLVNVSINGGNSIITDSLGRYSFNVPEGNNYIISPTKNNDKTIANGVNGTDISLIQSHILKKVILNSPYKLIAADVNSDGTVNGTDIALIKSLILKHITKFAGNKLWAFVDSNYTFTAPTKPFPFHDSISIAAINANQTGKNFIGVKLGDVNFDWVSTTLGIGISTTPIELFNDNILVNTASTEVRVPIRAKNFKNIMGMQYTLNFNSNSLELKVIENNHLNIDYNTDYVSEGKISFLWVNPQSEATTLSDSTILFELVFNKKGILNNEFLDISSDITSINAFDGNYSTVGIIKVGGKISEQANFSDNILVYPNPAKNFITIKGKHISEIQIIDNTGKTIKTIPQFDAAKPSIQINGLKAGVYHLRIQTTNGKIISVGFVKE